jgi:hypothetical protein
MPREVTCPICLSHLDWGDMKPFRWDKTRRVYEELAEADLAGLSPEQETLLMQTVSWRCPNLGAMGMHFLPDAYGKHGKPVVLGFVGDSSSGKTHLLAAMIGEIERGELARGALARYGLSWRPVDQYRHQVFLDENVRPLLDRSQVLSRTGEQIISFADALLIGQGANEPRPVALFDVAGEELKDATDAKRFLEIADGFIFVIDPDHLGSGNKVDPTFSAVLSSMSGRLGSVSAAVVLNKADQCRFDDPVALWMRRAPDPFDQEAGRQESADVYAYLYRRKASACARPFRECGRATLHVASATGGRRGEGADDRRYPRGVHPQRVLAPLLSLLVMTGLLDLSKAEA